MTDKELRKLNRMELLAILVEQSKELDEIKAQLKIANEKIESRRVALSNVGSIAEASLLLNEVFSSAQKAADEYLENVKNHHFSKDELRRESDVKESSSLLETKARCEKMEAEMIEKCKEYERMTVVKCNEIEKMTAEKCDRMESEIKQKCERAENETAEKCKEMIRLADAKARAYVERLMKEAGAFSANRKEKP